MNSKIPRNSWFVHFSIHFKNQQIFSECFLADSDQGVSYSVAREHRHSTLNNEAKIIGDRRNTKVSKINYNFIKQKQILPEIIIGEITLV